MNIVEPYAKILGLTSGIDLLKKIEWYGRISHRSEGTQTEDSWKRFIQAVVIEHGDWSIVEHVSVTVDFLVDRGITHELVRHRLFLSTQESTRFVNYEKKKMPASFIEPQWRELMNHYSGDPELSLNQKIGVAQNCWENTISLLEERYKTLLSLGLTPQVARSVLPNALASRIIVTANLRNWRHFLIMRTTKETHPQMRQVTIPLLQEFKAVIPILFDDIEPLQKQSLAIQKAR